MTMRDEIAAIIHAGTKQALSDYDIADDVIRNDPEIAEADRATADAIIADLPGMVVPLVWSKAQTVGYAENVIQRSGQYRIGNVGADWVVTGFSHFVGLTYPTLEAAKAAANAHNAAAVCKAMGLAP